MLVCGIVLWLAGLAQVGQSAASSEFSGVSIGLMLAASASQAFRSFRPGLCFVLGTGIVVADTVIGMTVPVWLIYSDIVFAAALYGTTRTARAMLGCAATLSVILTVTSAALTDWRTTILVAVLLVAVVGAPAAYGFAIREHRNAADLAVQRGEALVQLAFRDHQRDIAAQRRQIARDLHDGIAGHLSAIALTTEAGLSADAHQQQATLAAVRRNALDALGDMRSMIAMLHDDTVDEVDDVAVVTMRHLDHLVADAQVDGTKVSLIGAVSELPREIDVTAYRIVREAITNSRTHAPGMPIEIELVQTATELTLSVRNPLMDAPLSKRSIPQRDWPQKLGLSSMRVRAQAVGGAVQVRHTDHDFQVCATLPLTAGVPSRARAADAH